MAKITAGVVGGTGYSARELCRLLLGHPDVGAILPTSRGNDPFELVHPNLFGSGLEFVPYERLRQAEVVFFCTPAGEAMRAAPELLAGGTKVVDVSADFRFRDAGTYHQVYGAPHAAPELLAEAACGITELHRDQVNSARLVANPGCYVNAAVLALAPLVPLGLDSVHLHAINGTSGAGSTPRREILHAEANGSMLPYNLEGHRHGPEIDARLAELGVAAPAVELSTAHGNFARGIYVQATVRTATALDRDALLARYREFYGPGLDKEPFVRVIDHQKAKGRNAKEYHVYPRMASVIGSNFCDLGVDVDERTSAVKVVSVLDNLVKGAAGAAIQNMNVMLGLAETAGLGQFGL